MTSASDGVPRSAADKTQHYERIRNRALDAHRPTIAAVSAIVLVRQGMSAWMLLDDSLDIESRAHDDIPRRQTSLPAPEHSELLAVLTSLVFNVRNQKESA